MNNDNSIFGRLTQFVYNVFKTNLEVFLEALKLSPNAQGYVAGSVTELLLKRKLEAEYGLEIKRIREKWEGRKHPNHHGDFYFRQPGERSWFVLESKGIKSNTEKWHKLYNFDNLKRFLIVHADKISWITPENPIEPQIEQWLFTHLPRFVDEYAHPLYEYEEVQRYLQNLPKRETPKTHAIQSLQAFNREQINVMIETRLQYVMTKIKVLETHFVSGTSESSLRTQATPRIDEFNIVAVDIFLRYPDHKFLFANPKLLSPSGADPHHLQQNYIMGFIFTEEAPSLFLTEEWYENFSEVLATLSEHDAIREEDMQIDNRQMVVSDDAEYTAG